jgi:predicted dehydrogenase
MKFVVIGLGSMGKRRVRNLIRLGHKQITGYDPRQDRRTETADNYEIETTGDLDAALAQDADAWIVSTPPDTHAAYGLRAADQGIAFFAEAGVADPDVEKLIERVRETGIVAAASCTMRYYDGPRKIKELAQSGAIGRPLSFVYHSGQYLPDWHPWESYKDFYVSNPATGACREIVPFELSWLVDIFGDVTSLAAMKAKQSDLDADIDDNYQLLLRFNGGAMGHMTVDVLARPAVRQFRLLGSEGTAEWDHTANAIRLWRAEDGDWEEISFDPGDVQDGYIHAEEPYVAEMADFVAAVRGEKPWAYSFEQDERVLALLVQAEKDSEARDPQ